MFNTKLLAFIKKVFTSTSTDVDTQKISYEYEFNNLVAAKAACKVLFECSPFGPTSELREFSRDGKTMWGVNGWEMF